MPYPRYLDIPEFPADQADLLMFPLPFEGTVSFGEGTAAGPEAIWNASCQVEGYEEEVDFDLFSLKYHTLPEVTPAENETPESYITRVETAAREALGKNKALLIGVGGEHSVTPALVRALDARAIDFSKLTVVQIDAHADLRDTYEETKCSHACAMRRLTDLGASVVAIGVRSADAAEARWGRESGRVRTFWDHALANQPAAEQDLMDLLGSLSGDVYLTIDIDGFDLSLCPGTGTPNPGGLGWWQGLRYLRRLLFDNKNIRLVGADLTEVVPQPNTQVNEFVAARLLGKIIAYAFK